MTNNDDLKMPPSWTKNGMIMGIVVFEALLLAIGLILILKGYFAGVFLGILSVIMFVTGLKEHKDKPLTVGLITVWNRPQKSVVAGTVPLLNFFPFLVSTIDIDMTLGNKDIPVEDVLSEDDVPMSGKVSVTFRPDTEDLLDYIGAGQMEGVFNVTDDLLIIQVEKYCKGKKWREIQQKSPDFEQELIDMIETGPFGVKVKKIQVRLTAPKELLNDVSQQQREEAQKRGELAEFDTTLEAARKRLKAITESGGNSTLEAQIAEINRERLIRNGKAMRVEGNASTVLLPDAKINLG